jgi:hypothetical protein
MGTLISQMRLMTQIIAKISESLRASRQRHLRSNKLVVVKPSGVLVGLL